MLPDVPAARSLLNELLLARIDARRIHFLGRRDTLPADLPEASFLQKTDFLHALRTGAAVGAVAGIAASTLILLYPPAYLTAHPSIVVVAALVGAALGAWSSSLVGSSVPNSALREFQREIESGKVLLMVDVPFARVEEVREMVAAQHPEAVWGGIAPQIPAFP
jgi:hypothetical protein